MEVGIMDNVIYLMDDNKNIMGKIDTDKKVISGKWFKGYKLKKN